MTTGPDEIKKKLDFLEAAIAEGALEVEFQGKRVRYRSLDEMRRIANALKRQLGGGSIRTTLAVFDKGL